MTTHTAYTKKRLIGAPHLVWLQRVPVSTATQYTSSPGVICSAARLSIRRRLLTYTCKVPKTLLIRLDMTEEGRRSIAAAEAMEVFGAATEQPSQAMETSQEAPERKEDAWDGWSSRDKKYQRKGRRWRQRNLVRLVEAQGAGGKLFGNRHSGSSNAKPDPVDDEACAEARERTRSPEARNGQHAVHRHGALLVPGAAQAGGHEVAGPLCGKQGHLAARPSADAGNGSGASEQTRSTPTRRCPPATLQELWLDQRRPECLHANVALLRVESHREERVSGEDPSASPHPGSGDLGRDGTLPSSAGGSSEVPGHEGHHSGGPGGRSSRS